MPIKGRQARRCKNRTLRSGYCQPHLQQIQNLRIKQSNINQAGFGLFNGRKKCLSEKGENLLEDSHNKIKWTNAKDY